MLNRNRGRGHLTLMVDYFTLNALFTNIFCLRFRMRKTVFDHLYHGIHSYHDYFILKKDAKGTTGFSSYQKCTAALQTSTYGCLIAHAEMRGQVCNRRGGGVWT